MAPWPARHQTLCDECADQRRAATNADTSTSSLPSGFYTPETLAADLALSLSTICSWNSSGYGPPLVKLGNLVRYTYEDVELWLTRQLELSRGVRAATGLGAAVGRAVRATTNAMGRASPLGPSG